MMMMIRIFALFCFIVGLHSCVFAQHTDFCGWLDAGVSFSANKKLSFELSEQVRNDFSVGLLYQANSDLTINYKINKHIKTSLDYRLSIRPGTDNNKAGVSISLSQKISKIELSLRSKYQYAFGSLQIEEPDQSAWRNKLNVSYKINKQLSPFISAELFYSIYYKVNAFNDYRIATGIDYSINRSQSISVYYLLDKEFNVNDPLTLSVAGIAYGYKF